MNKTTLYLAGAVAEASDHGVGWREKVKEKLSTWGKCDYRDPLDKYNIPIDGLEIVDTYGETPNGVVSVSDIVEGDKEMIDKSDVLFVGYNDVKMVGTSMEVMYAYENDMPIVFWLRGNKKNNLSPWFQYHGDFFANNLTSAIACASNTRTTIP